MSEKIAKYSRAEIVRESDNTLIRLVEIIDIERLLISMLKKYLIDVGFHQKYPKFGNIRVDAVHPFVIQLLKEAANQPYDMNVFPSVTISDSSDSRSSDMLGQNIGQGTWTEGEIAYIESAVAQDLVFVSDENMQRLKDRVAAAGFAVYNTYYDISTHSVDFNIWADNHIVKNDLYDIVRHFLISHIQELHNRYQIDYVSDVNGNKSGDINLEFGRILYGANLNVRFSIPTTSSVVDLTADTIQAFNVHDTFTRFYP